MQQRPRLTAQNIRDLPLPAKGSKIHYDAPDKQGRDYVRGFGVCVTSTGYRSFILNYRFEGREHRLTIGAASAWSLAAARLEAAGLRRMIDRGEDPMSGPTPLSGAPTMAELTARFEREELPRRRPATQRSYRTIIAAVLPALGLMPVAAITTVDIEALHRRLSVKVPILANRIITFLHGLFKLAIKWGLREGNPAIDLERNAEAARERYLTAAELDRLLVALEKIDDRQAAAIFRLLLLTGARKGEVLSARWSDIDLEAGVWARPASATKIKNKPRTPLSKPAIALLRGMPRNGVFVFPSPRKANEHRAGIRAAWNIVCRLAQIENFRSHDLRHSFASFAVQGGASLEIIGGLLGHSSPGTTARYSHLNDASMRAVAERVGKIITKE